MAITSVHICVAQIKEGNLNEYCKCAGGFGTVLRRDDLAQTFRTFRSIARYVTSSIHDVTDVRLQCGQRMHAFQCVES